MALRVLFFITLLLLADAQKWPVSGDCGPCQCSYKTTSFGRMRTVNCSRRGLSAIPASLPDDLMALDLSWNVLNVDLLRQHLCKYPSLQSVSLSFADLTTLSDVLKECSSVLELNLTGNRLDEVDSKTFMGLKNLRRLLGLEVESVVTRDIFKHLTNLKDLDVIFHGPNLPKGLFDDLGIQSLNLVVTQAASLPLRVFEFGQKTLNTLQLIGERVTQLDEDLLDGLFVLKKLYIVMPSVKQLPERFFHSQKLQPGDRGTKVANLQEVEISGIHSLPAMLFSNLVTLETLQLKEIGRFPQMGFLAGAINLRTLLVTGSKLTRIPEGWFRQLYSLETLTLSGLQLERLDENAFQGLISLNYLDLSDNNLAQITAKMLMPLDKTLETLILRGNFLTQINKEVLGKLGTLRLLDVSENRLTNVHASSFGEMTYLCFLYLNNNRLTSLPQDLFKDLLQVQSLSLSENYLVEFPKAVLQLNRSLMNLDLASNELREVPAFRLCKFMYLETINIMGNYLDCGCPLLAFNQCKQISVEGQCKYPPEYLNMYISNIEVPNSCAEENRAKQMLDTQRKGNILSTTQSAIVGHGSVSQSPRTEAPDVQFSRNITIVRKLFPEKFSNKLKNLNDALISSTTTTTTDSLHLAENVSVKSVSPTKSPQEQNDIASLHREELALSSVATTNKKTVTSKPIITNQVSDIKVDSQAFSKETWISETTSASRENPENVELTPEKMSIPTSVNEVQGSNPARLSPGEDNVRPSKTAKNPSSIGEEVFLGTEHKDVMQKSVKPNSESTQDQMMGDSPSQGITESSQIANQSVKFSDWSSSKPPAQSSQKPQRHSAKRNSSKEQLAHLFSNSTGSGENPVSDENTDSVLTIRRTALSSTTPIGFEESIRNKMEFNATSTPNSVISSVEWPIEPVNNESYQGSAGVEISNSVISAEWPIEPVNNETYQRPTGTEISNSVFSSVDRPFEPVSVNNKTYQGPTRVEISNDTIGNKEPEKMASNFIISALVALVLSGCVVLGIIFVHQWQQKGSYSINEESEVHNLDSDSVEAAAVFAKEKVESV